MVPLDLEERRRNTFLSHRRSTRISGFSSMKVAVSGLNPAISDSLVLAPGAETSKRLSEFVSWLALIMQTGCFCTTPAACCLHAAIRTEGLTPWDPTMDLLGDAPWESEEGGGEAAGLTTCN